MPEPLEVQFVPLSAAPAGAVLLLAGQELALGVGRARHRRAQQGRARPRPPAPPTSPARPRRPSRSWRPPASTPRALILLGTGRAPKELDRLLLGGFAFAQISARKGEAGTLVAEPADPGEVSAEVFAADLALGALLRSYTFKKYRTAQERGGRARRRSRRDGLRKLVVQCAKPDAAAKAFAARKARGRRRVPRPRPRQRAGQRAGPRRVRRAHARAVRAPASRSRCSTRSSMRELKMGALLAVGQGSERPSRMVVLQWHGAKSKRAKTLCFVGKGVCFDTGGISMKPAGGMEDMKGDMGGAACVAGLMLALAARKAAVNAVGLIGLAENMPSGTAQRPGDIVTSMSGQTIEVHQHRRRRPPRAGRRALVRAGALQAALHRRPRHADRRHHGGARQGVRRPVRQRRQARRPSCSPPARRRARRCGACRSPRPTTS